MGACALSFDSAPFRCLPGGCFANYRVRSCGLGPCAQLNRSACVCLCAPSLPLAARQIRDSPKHKKWGGFIDILEHSAYCNKVREADGDGFLFDGTVAPGESECDEDPFTNGYLTEDELVFDEDYVPRCALTQCGLMPT